MGDCGVDKNCVHGQVEELREKVRARNHRDQDISRRLTNGHKALAQVIPQFRAPYFRMHIILHGSRRMEPGSTTNAKVGGGCEDEGSTIARREKRLRPKKNRRCGSSNWLRPRRLKCFPPWMLYTRPSCTPSKPISIRCRSDLYMGPNVCARGESWCIHVLACACVPACEFAYLCKPQLRAHCCCHCLATFLTRMHLCTCMHDGTGRSLQHAACARDAATNTCSHLRT